MEEIENDKELHNKSMREYQLTKNSSFSIYKLFCFFILLNILDVIITIFLLETSNGFEGNPFVRILITQFGYMGLIMLKVIGIIVIFYVFYIFQNERWYNKNLIFVPCLVLGMAVIWNICMMVIS